MKKQDQSPPTACGGCAMSRRRFLAGCAACATAAAGLGALPRRAARAARAAETTGKPKIRLVFSHTPSTGPIWPYIGFDFEPRKKELTEKLHEACPGIELLPVTAMNVEEAKKVLADDTEVDGYLVYFESCWTGVPGTIAAAGKPTIFVDDLYQGSGEWLIANAAVRRQGQKVAGISTSRFEDVIDAVRTFEILKQPGGSVDAFLAACNASRKKNTKPVGDMTCAEDPVEAIDAAKCIEKLRSSTILVIGANPVPYVESIPEVFGTKVLPMDFQELNQFYEEADPDQSRQIADRWIGEAEKVIEPSRETIEKSAAMYLAMKAMLEKHSAQAIAINCLGGFYGKFISAYPCLGFQQLNNDGLVGACEADLVSTITMLTMSHMTGRPGYISDPVIDTSKNQIIYAHCVAPSKVFGPEGPANPYHIRNHSEDRQGAAIRSLMPLGYMTTSIELHPLRKEVIFHQGKSVENVDDDKACRTKLAAEVKGDIEKLMDYWDQWGWHRVTFYGDLKGPVQQMAEALKLSFIEEA